MADADPRRMETETAADDAFVLESSDVPGVKGALLRYRFMAYLVGVLLVILILVGVTLKYLSGDAVVAGTPLVDVGNFVVKWTGMPHGWLYMILIITAYDLSRRVGWSIKWVLMIMLAGTIPFLSFVAEHYATKDVRAKLAAVKE